MRTNRSWPHKGREMHRAEQKYVKKPNGREGPTEVKAANLGWQVESGLSSIMPIVVEISRD